MSTLYRKYRPQTFTDVYGQAHIKRTIQNEIQMDQISHAYLFCGPRGVGKTTMARLVAKAANCLNRVEGSFEPCNTCDACVELMEGRSLDVIEIDAASHTGVDHVREYIINAARFVPNSRKYKIFIIDEVHMLSTAAFNALLKILEEPPEYVKFVLATTEIHKILPTIISRCQRFDFKKIDSQNLRNRLQLLVESEGKKVDDAVYNIIIKNADGCLRDAESLLGQILILDEKHITLEQVELVLPVTNYRLVDTLVAYIANKDIKGAITMINTMVQDGINLEQFTRDFVEYVRKILLYSIHQTYGEFALDLDELLQQKIKEWAEVFDITHLLTIIDVFLKTLTDLKTSPIIQLPLELAVVAVLDGSVVTTQSNINIQKQLPSQQVSTRVTTCASETKAPQVPVPEQTAVEQDTHVKEPEEQQPQSMAIVGNISFDTIIGKWGNFTNKIQQDNYSLSCVLSAAVPREVQGSKLILACKHKFNIEKLHEVKSKGILEQALSEIYGVTLIINVIHDPQLDSNINDDSSITLGEVLKMGRPNVPATEDNNTQTTQTQQVSQPTGDEGGIDQVLDLFGGSVVG